eukprot:scaffold63514_cov18-Tisochrysis_lutea.AAC.1
MDVWNIAAVVIGSAGHCHRGHHKCGRLLLCRLKLQDIAIVVITSAQICCCKVVITAIECDAAPPLNVQVLLQRRHFCDAHGNPVGRDQCDKWVCSGYDLELEAEMRTFFRRYYTHSRYLSATPAALDKLALRGTNMQEWFKRVQWFERVQLLQARSRYVSKIMLRRSLPKQDSRQGLLLQRSDLATRASKLTAKRGASQA